MLTNWAGNVRFAAARVHRPADVAELQEIVATARRVKALGTGHSFNRIADTDGELVATTALRPRIDIDVAARTVQVAAGVRFGELAPALEGSGLALHNLGSLPHISVAGACATGTHGSGVTNGNLAAAVRAMTLVTADGELRTVAGTDLAAAAVHLGALGIVTDLTLHLVESYRLRQYVYTGLTRRRLVADLDEILAAAYSVSVFTSWTDGSRIWFKQDANEGLPPRQWLGAGLATVPLAPIEGGDPRSATAQLGEPGPWHERLPHFRLEFTPSWGEELQSEYFLPRGAAAGALDAMFGMHDRLAPVLLVSEIRAVAADEFWASPAYRRDSVTLHFTWVADAAAVAPVVAEVERRLAPFEARPHWGKVFSTAPAAVAGSYPRLGDFAARARELDPTGKFGNEFLYRYLPDS